MKRPPPLEEVPRRHLFLWCIINTLVRAPPPLKDLAKRILYPSGLRHRCRTTRSTMAVLNTLLQAHVLAPKSGGYAKIFGLAGSYP